MKRLIILLVAVLSAVSCSSPGLRDSDASLAPDTSDLLMTPDVQNVFASRRAAILDTIGEGILVIRSDYGYNGGRHEYRTASNFWYLTGYAQPGSILALSGAGDGSYVLYSRQRSIREMIYTGNLPDPAEITKTWGPDTLLDYNEVENDIAEAALAGRNIYIDFRDQLFRNHVTELVKQEKAPEALIRDIGGSLAEMRIFKDDYETGMLQKAVDITGVGINEALKACKPGMYEFEIEALLEYTWRRLGSSMPGFESIVGSGENAVTLHYSANNRKMEEGDLLLMDIGAEYGYYTADITRTIPVSGRFSEEQRDIYDLVLKALKAAIDEMKPGNAITAGHVKATGIIMNGLYDLGLVTDPESQWQRKFYTLYPINHYLGLDVHDVGSIGIPLSMSRTFFTSDTAVGRPFQKGMILTVEPGIYLRANGLEQLEILYGSEAEEGEIEAFREKVGPVYEKYKNIGVRIEDDVLITDDGCRVLSASIPREPEEIERIMK